MLYNGAEKWRSYKSLKIGITEDDIKVDLAQLEHLNRCLSNAVL